MTFFFLLIVNYFNYKIPGAWGGPLPVFVFYIEIWPIFLRPRHLSVRDRRLARLTRSTALVSKIIIRKLFLLPSQSNLIPRKLPLRKKTSLYFCFLFILHVYIRLHRAHFRLYVFKRNKIS